MTRVNKAEAAEWLGSLQQIGQGWYINVALAVKAGAPQALGMTARDFAKEIGQQLINPDDAIIELYGQKHSMARIAQVLGISEHRVEFVLAKADLISITSRRQQMLDAGTYTLAGSIAHGDRTWEEVRAEQNQAGQPDSAGQNQAGQLDPEIEKLKRRIAKLTEERDALTEQADEEYGDLQDQLKDLKKRVKKLGIEKSDALREAREEVWSMMTDQERDRAKKEADAWAQAEADALLSGLSGGYARNVISALHEAAESLSEFITAGHGVSKQALADIEAAHTGFIEELNRARMAELTE